MGEKSLFILLMGLISRTYKEPKKPNKSSNNSINKWASNDSLK